MADVEKPYSTQTFNSLPDLHAAQSNFNSNGGLDLVNNILQPLIIQHRLESVLGIGLLHRHFELLGEEKLVEFNNISTPWKHQRGGYSHSGGQIMPCAWMIDADGESLIPYEFYFSPLGHDSRVNFSTMNDFLKEFIQCIRDSGLKDTLGLRLFPRLGFAGALEFTEGRANINLTPDQTPPELWNDSTETMWFFEPNYLSKKYSCQCKPYSGHMHYHTNL